MATLKQLVEAKLDQIEYDETNLEKGRVWAYSPSTEYNDFNKRNMRSLYIENKTDANYSYISNGYLLNKFFIKDTIVNDIKCIPNNSITLYNKEFVILVGNHQTSDDTYNIAGIHNENKNYLYINSDYELRLYKNDIDTLIHTFSPTTAALTIKFYCQQNTINIIVNNENYDYATTDNYVNLFMCGCQNIIYYECYYSRFVI
jgi:hypothetical protein